MFDGFSNADVFLNDLTASDIVYSLSLNDIKRFLESLGVEQIIVNEEKEYIICPTICHNPIETAESMKLYWYHNYKIFRCYTECNDSMSIYELYRRYMEINHYKISLGEAIEYVKQFVNCNFIYTPIQDNKEELDLKKYEYDSNIPILKEYDSKVLDCGIPYYHPAWARDGIKFDVMNKFNIRYSIYQNKILIPHYDINNRLIGIRGRAFNQEELDEGRKYCPVQIGNTLYTHSLMFNLYGINFHKEGIKKRKSAILVEAEKSVLLDDGFYGKYSNCVACCGSTFNKYQISLLANYCGVTEIVVALDKEYTDWKSEKGKKYRNKIVEACKKYSYLASFSYIWDYDNLLNEKDSPYDKGQDVFEYLYKNRIKVR